MRLLLITLMVQIPPNCLHTRASVAQQEYLGGCYLVTGLNVNMLPPPGLQLLSVAALVSKTG
jgi:hypothetical protein